MKCWQITFCFNHFRSCLPIWDNDGQTTPLKTAASRKVVKVARNHHSFWFNDIDTTNVNWCLSVVSTKPTHYVLLIDMFVKLIKPTSGGHKQWIQMRLRQVLINWTEHVIAWAIYLSTCRTLFYGNNTFTKQNSTLLANQKCTVEMQKSMLLSDISLKYNIDTLECTRDRNVQNCEHTVVH